ncbi:Tn3 family transposase [Streptomyces sp. NPDC051636]|uniref:Tn3 family transposase n=1 Tax=Streptomyces sp. NPDC051636 TaxID=3365663 RepID=UPI003787C097
MLTCTRLDCRRCRWNTLYMDAAVKELEAGGLTISPEIRSRLSPLVHEHINSTAGTRSSAPTATARCARCATRPPPRNNPGQPTGMTYARAKWCRCGPHGGVRR